MVALGGNAIKIIISATDRASAVITGVKGKIGGLGGAMNKLRGPMLALGAASVGMAALSVKAFADFETSMAKVNTLLDEGENATELYGDSVARLAEEYGVAGGRVAVAAGLYQTISAGISDATDATMFLEAATRAAVGGSAELETVILAGTKTMAAFGGLALGETGAAYGKAQKACATGVSTTERIKAVLGFTASGAAATGAIFVRNGPTTAAAAPYCFITAFGINAGIDLKNAQEKVQRGDKAGAAIDLSNAAANLYQTIGGVWGGIMHSKAGLMYAASVVSVAQALLDLARQLRTIPEQTIAGEERSLVDESGRGGKSPSPSHSDSGGE